MRIERCAMLLFTLAVLNFLSMVLSHTQPISLRRALSNAEIVELEDDKQYWSGVTDYCVCGQYLYLLLDNAGVVKIYDLDGAYQRAYAFPVSKGTGLLRTDGESVYLFDQRHNKYSFIDARFEGFTPYTNYSTFMQEQDQFVSEEHQRTDSDGSVYRLKHGSVYKENGESKRILKRPLILWAVQEPVQLLIQFVLIATALFLVIKENGFGRFQHS